MAIREFQVSNVLQEIAMELYGKIDIIPEVLRHDEDEDDMSMSQYQGESNKMYTKSYKGLTIRSEKSGFGKMESNENDRIEYLEGKVIDLESLIGRMVVRGEAGLL